MQKNKFPSRFNIRLCCKMLKEAFKLLFHEFPFWVGLFFFIIDVTKWILTVFIGEKALTSFLESRLNSEGLLIVSFLSCVVYPVAILVSVCKICKNADLLRTFTEEKRVFAKHTFKVNKIILSSDQKHLVSASDKVTYVWDIDTQRTVQLVSETWIGNILFMNNDKNIIGIGGGKGLFYEWGVDSGEAINSSQLETTDSVALAKTSDEKFIATANKNGEITIWQYPTLVKNYALKLGSREVKKIAFSDDNRYLVGCDVSGNVTLFSLPEGNPLILFTHPKNSPIRYVCFSPTRDEIAFIDGDGNLYVCNFVEEKILFTKQAHKGMGLCCTFNGNGNYIASGGQDNTIIIWKRLKNKLNKEIIIQGHTDAVTTLVFDKRNNLYSGSRDKLIKYWDIGKYFS